MTRSEDRASTLLFFPATLLVMVVLASITVDFARLHLAQRQVDDLAAATANDAVTVGLDVTGLRAGGQYHLAPGRIRSVAEAHADHAPLPVARRRPGDRPPLGRGHGVGPRPARLRRGRSQGFRTG